MEHKYSTYVLFVFGFLLLIGFSYSFDMTDINDNCPSNNTFLYNDYGTWIQGTHENETGFNITIYGWHNISTIANDANIVLNMWMEQNASDISGNGNNGVCGNADGDENASGIVGYGYLFDGVNDYIQINTGFNYNTTTIILWINPKDITKDLYVTGRGNKLSLLLGYQDNYFNIFHNGGYITGTASDTQISATQNTWQQIVYSSDSSRVYGYKNGELIINVSGNLNTSGLTDYYLGTGYGTPFFNGSIDEVQIWNRSLSSGEISAIYNNSKPITYNSTRLYRRNVCS